MTVLRARPLLRRRLASRCEAGERVLAAERALATRDLWALTDRAVLVVPNRRGEPTRTGLAEARVTVAAFGSGLSVVLRSLSGGTQIAAFPPGSALVARLRALPSAETPTP